MKKSAKYKERLKSRFKFKIGQRISFGVIMGPILETKTKGAEKYYTVSCECGHCNNAKFDLRESDCYLE